MGPMRAHHLRVGILCVPSAQAQFVCDSVAPGGGNGATATGAASVACGTLASALTGSTSFGNLAGFGTVPGSVFNTAIGNSAGTFVNGNNNTATGNISGSTVNGNFNAAYGDSAGQNVLGDFNAAFGSGAGVNVA